MNRWAHITYKELMNLESGEKKALYMKKYRYALIHIINPLYDALNSKQKKIIDEFDKNKTLYELTSKLKELHGGRENSWKILLKSRVNGYRE